QGLDQHRGLNRHVERAGDADPGQRLRLRILAANRHQAGHLLLGHHNLFAAPFGQLHVCDFVVSADFRQRCCAHASPDINKSRYVDILAFGLYVASILKSLKVLADTNRLRLLLLLEREELTVAELQEILSTGQSRISTHLAQLKQAGLVEDRKQGKHSLYRLKDRQLIDLLHAAAGEIPEAA